MINACKNQIKVLSLHQIIKTITIKTIKIMKATFKTFAKMANFAELLIEGTFGDGFTYHDFKDYDKPFLKDMLNCWDSAYIVIRTTGTQNGNGIHTEERAREIAKEWFNASHIFHFTHNDGQYTIETIKL